MEKLSKSWVALVAAAALLGTLVGVVWARPHDTPDAQDITRKVTLTGAEFAVGGAGQQWQTDGSAVYCVTGSCYLVAPVVFPCLPSVTVERIRLHVADGNGSFYALARLYRAQPANHADVLLGQVSSPTGTAAFQTWNSQPINKVVWPSQRAYVRLDIFGPSITVWGVTVEYHRNI
jgi:hypothetical protein